MDFQVNYVAVLSAGVVAMAVGFLWYSPMVLGKPWMRLMGYTKESMEAAKKEMTKTYAISFLAALLMAYVLSHVITLSQSFYQLDRLTTGLTSAFWMWLGFVAPVQLIDVLFGGKVWKLFAINTSYQLVSLLVMGVVLALIV